MSEIMSKDGNKVDKIKVTSAEIVVHGNTEKPYYEIKYYDLKDNAWHIGYSSYDLNFVFQWLDECFEIAKESQSSESDLISRKALIKDICNYDNGMTDEELLEKSSDWWDGINFKQIEVMELINNQPQVQPICCGCTYDYEHSYLDARLKADGWTKQPIVRSAEEIADEVEKVCLTIQGYNKPKELQFAMFDKKDFIDWLLGKEV